MCKFSISSSHNAVDQRSRESQISRRSYDIAADCRAERLPRPRNASCEDCVCIEKDYHECALPKESKCQRATCSKIRQNLTRKVAHTICEYFRATGAYEAVQGLSDLFSFRLQDDDVQDFDTRWDQAPLAAIEIPTETVLEGLCKSNYRIPFSFTLYWQCMNKRTSEITNTQTAPD